MSTVKSETAFGKMSELKLECFMHNRFQVKPTKNRYDHFDYQSDTMLIELKTRRCFKDSYPDFMMNSKKIEFAYCSLKEIWFCFQFTDGLYGWKYDRNLNLRSDINGRTDRGMDERAHMYYIPSNLLIRLDAVDPLVVEAV